MNTRGLYSEAVHGIRWIGFTKGLSQLLMWIVTIYVIRLLDPEDYGIMAMGGILLNIAGLLLDAGLGAALVQRREVPTSVYRSANGALLLSAGIVVGIVQALAWPLAQFFSEPVLEAVLRVSAIQFPISALAVVPSAILMRQRQFKELGIAAAVAGVGGSLFSLGFAWKGFGVWALVAGALSVGAIRMVLFAFFAGRPVGFSLRLSLLSSYLAFSANLVGQRLVWFYVEQVDRLIIGKTLGASPLGAYSVARHLSHIPLDRTVGIVNQVTLPSFAAVQDEKERWHLALRKLIRLASVVAYPLFLGMAAVAPVGLPLLLGERWQGAVWPFMLFCVALPLRTAHSLLATVLFALGRADVSFKIVLVWAAVLSPLFLVGVRFGVVGVAAAWAIGFPFVYLLGARLVAKSLSIPQASLWTPMLAPAISAAGCVGMVLIVHTLLAGELRPSAILTLDVVGGAITYGFLLRVLSRSAFDEILDLLRRLAGRGQPA